MPHTNEHPVTKAILLSWSIIFFLYALLGVWAGTGQDALGGPSTVKDNILSGIWLSFSIAQLVIATSLYKRYRLWLFRCAIACTVFSASMILGPLLALLVTA